MTEPAGTAAADPVLYHGQCFQAAIEGRTFLRINNNPQVPHLGGEFMRLSEMASVPIHGSDGQQVEFQVRKVDKGGDELKTENEKIWKGTRALALKYGVTAQGRQEGYDPLQVLAGNETSNIRVRWVVKDLTPPPSTPSECSPEMSFDNVTWNCAKVREITSSNVSPANDAEAAAEISKYMRTESPAPVWWTTKVESALQLDHEEAYREALRRARAQGKDTGPLRGPTDEYTQELRDKRAK